MDANLPDSECGICGSAWHDTPECELTEIPEQEDRWMPDALFEALIDYHENCPCSDVLYDAAAKDLAKLLKVYYEQHEKQKQGERGE